MGRYVWTVQPVKGLFGNPAETDWTILMGTYRLRGFDSEARARRRAIERAKEAADDVPPGSDLVVEVADGPFGDKPTVEVWRMTTEVPKGRTKRRPSQ